MRHLLGSPLHSIATIRKPLHHNSTEIFICNAQATALKLRRLLRRLAPHRHAWMHEASPGPHITARLNCWNLLNNFPDSYFVLCYTLWECITYLGSMQPFSDFIVLIISLISRSLSTFWHFGSFKVIQNVKLSVMRAHSCYRSIKWYAVRVFFCVPVSEKMGSIGQLAGNSRYSKLSPIMIHSIRR